MHYVWTLPDPSADFHLEFKHFLSIYAAKLHWYPKAIYIHTNALDSTIARAKDGYITFEEHKADFIRAAVLHEMGGVYIDWDVYIAPLRRAGFNAVVGRTPGRQMQVNSGALLTMPGLKMSRIYMERMHVVYDGAYTTHSNLLLIGICEKLVGEPGEVLILDQNAFTPGRWLAKDLNMLYEVHTDVPSNLDGVSQGDELPSHPDERTTAPWDVPDNLSYSGLFY